MTEEERGTDRYRDILCPDCSEGLLHPAESEDWWECEHCRHQFANKRVEQLVGRRIDRDVEQGVRYAMRVDARKKRGNSRGSKNSVGKGDNFSGTTLHRLDDDSVMLTKIRALDPKSVMLTFRNMAEDVTSETLRAALFLYCQWRDAQRQAEQGGSR